jgi:Ala-tRNA(Pro) deacylase
MKCRERMEQYLRENGVGFEVDVHSQAFTMQEVAAALHVPGKQVAKVVMVRADSRLVMLVLAAPDRLDFRQVQEMLQVKEANLAKEEDFAGIFPDCDTGAMPPFGNLYDVATYVDQRLAEESDIVFRIGSHREAMKIAFANYARLAKPTVAEFARSI